MSTHRQQGRAKKRGSPEERRQTRQEGRKDRQLTRELIYQLRRVYHPSVGFCAQVQLVGHSLHIDQLVATQTSLCIILVNKLRGHLFQLLHICGGQNFKRGGCRVGTTEKRGAKENVMPLWGMPAAWVTQRRTDCETFCLQFFEFSVSSAHQKRLLLQFSLAVWCYFVVYQSYLCISEGSEMSEQCQKSLEISKLLSFFFFSEFYTAEMFSSTETHKHILPTTCLPYQSLRLNGGGKNNNTHTQKRKQGRKKTKKRISYLDHSNANREGTPAMAQAQLGFLQLKTGSCFIPGKAVYPSPSKGKI